MKCNRLILVLDDETSSYKGILRLKERLGADTIHFRDISELVEWVSNLDTRCSAELSAICLIIDAKFVDIFQIRNLSEFLSRHPKLLISRPIHSVKIITALRFGIFDFIEKPFRLDTMLRKLEQALLSSELTKNISGNFNNLTKREFQTCELVVKGLTSKEISEKLNIAVKTVKVHRGNLMRKVQAKSVTDLLRAYDIFIAVSNNSMLIANTRQK